MRMPPSHVVEAICTRPQSERRDSRQGERRADVDYLVSVLSNLALHLTASALSVIGRG